jgi:hypothetical protein
MRIPMRGRVGSLNAAVAGSILLFEALEQRLPAIESESGLGTVPMTGQETDPQTGAENGDQADVDGRPGTGAAAGDEARSSDPEVPETAAPTKARARPRRAPRA